MGAGEAMSGAEAVATARAAELRNVMSIIFGAFIAVMVTLIAIIVQTSAGLRFHMIWFRSCAFGAAVGALAGLVIRAM